MAAKRNWSELPQELLFIILKNLSFIGFVYFKSVCSSWDKAAITYISSHTSPGANHSPFHQTPWLMMLPRKENNNNKKKDKHSSSLRFFSISEKLLVYTLSNMFQEFRKATCIGSSHGWLIIHHKKRNNYFHVLNPYSRTIIQLPCMEKSYDIYKAIIVSSGNNIFRVVLMVFGRYPGLAVYKHGDKKWAHTQLKNRYSDIALHNGQIYALSQTGPIDVWDFHSLSPVEVVDVGNFPTRLEPWMPTSFPERILTKSYLVESLGKLLILDRITIDVNYTNTMRFILHKLDYYSEKNCIPIENVPPGLAFFVCGNSAVSVLIRDFPELEENSVYYFDDENYLRRYDLKEQICVTYGLGNYWETDSAFWIETIQRDRDCPFLGFFT